VDHEAVIDEPAETNAVKARRLTQEFIRVDTHVDVPYRMQQGIEDISSETESGDFDFARARDGGLNAPFMSIYVPSS
jgi:membrane dipeptidase